MILNNYKPESTINSNSIYEWINATDIDGISAVLQIAQSSLTTDEINSLFDYFQALHSLKSIDGFVVPEVASDNKHHLILTYSDWHGEPLSETLKKDPSKALKYWERISYDYLHKLHQKNLVHGFLTLDSLIVIDGQVKIRNFGYAPLLRVYHQAAINICNVALAPAYIYKQEFSSLTDIYAFAQMVISCHPELKSTAWYERSTFDNLSDRFTKIRESFSELSKAWKHLDSDKTPISESPLIPKPTTNGSGLIPKYELTVSTEPKEGGTVKGGGSFKEGERVTIKASANSGWKLDRWSGIDSVSNKMNETLGIVINDNLNITAHFVSLLPEEVKIDGIKKKNTKQEIKLSSNRIKWPTISVIFLAVMGGGYAFSPNISSICRPLGNCQEYIDTIGKAEIELKNSETVIKSYKNIEELKVASDRLKSLIALTKTIPQNAKIYDDAQKAILRYQTNLGELTSRISIEINTQVALKEADTFIQESKQIVKTPTIENLDQAIEVQQKALQKLTAIPTTSIYKTKLRETTIQEYKKQIQDNTNSRNRLIDEQTKGIILWGPGSEPPISQGLNPQPSEQQPSERQPSEPLRPKSLPVEPLPPLSSTPEQPTKPPLWGPGSEPAPKSDNKPLW